MKIIYLTAGQIETFNRRIRKNDGDCWDWLGSVNSAGYGMFSQHPAHRVQYYLTHGGIPDKLVIDHICQNRGCVNPEHLRAVTSRVNALENSHGWGAYNAAVTECTKGHPYDEESWDYTHTKRRCRVCSTEYARAYSERKKREKNIVRIRSYITDSIKNDDLPNDIWEEMRDVISAHLTGKNDK